MMHVKTNEPITTVDQIVKAINAQTEAIKRATLPATQRGQIVKASVDPELWMSLQLEKARQYWLAVEGKGGYGFKGIKTCSCGRTGYAIK